MKVVLRVLLALFCIPLLTGCSAEYWAGAYKPSTRFEVSAGPYRAKFVDSKDNNVHIGKVEYNPTTKTWALEDLTIINNSSEVVNATSARALNVAVAQQTQVSYVQAVTAGIANIIGATGSAAPPILSAFFSRLPAQESSGVSFDIPGIGGISTNSTTTRPPANPTPAGPPAKTEPESGPTH